MLKHIVLTISLALLLLFLLCTASFAASDVKLAWTNGDNTGLPVRGVRIYYGNAPGEYDHTQDVPFTNGPVTETTVKGLADGTWYFAATAYGDTPEQESIFSNEVSTTLVSKLKPPTAVSITVVTPSVTVNVNVQQ